MQARRDPKPPVVIADYDTYGSYVPDVFVGRLENIAQSAHVYFVHDTPHGFSCLADAIAWLKVNRNHETFDDVFDMVLEDLRLEEDGAVLTFQWDLGSIVTVDSDDTWCEQHGQWASMCCAGGAEEGEFGRAVR